ncbi:hypothetical protein A1359_12640 [Methylomonas lenta]|uniref:OmpR/PhoB-type domain-containing protein n=1 Tax=Methylomonas lenta TaxID=980561 RepID=A0A177N5X1_9GAMM|nr:winged helix-turn-helix domain-containing protein [Methylomonas lenta]OAI13245.1 hypothetical protein A1359_12640 [Methylomonas lenta]
MTGFRRKIKKLSIEACILRQLSHIIKIILTIKIMKILNSISVVDNDKYFLGLLKGYCYVNNIILNEHDFDMAGVKEIEVIRPALVFFSLELLGDNTKVLDTLLSIIESMKGNLMVCGLNKNSADIYNGIPGWFGEVINDSICEVDWFIKKKFCLDVRSADDRRFRERRNFKERRSGDSNNFADYGSILSVQRGVERICFKGLRIDSNNKCVFLNDRRVDLTRKEFDLIELLSTDIDRIYSAEEIINHIWPENSRATKSDLYQYMHLLRKKIENDPNNPRWIMTIKGFGYRLNLHNADIEKQEALCS